MRFKTDFYYFCEQIKTNIMKKLALLILLISCTLLSFGQEETKEKKLATIPSVDIKALDGQSFNTINIDNDGKPIIISLWATWCKPCIAE